MTELWEQPPYVQMMILAIVFLLPAYVVGRFLPSEAKLTGPFQGLNLSFGGSAAFYLVLVLVGIVFIENPLDHRPSYETIRLGGTLTFRDPDGSEKEARLVRVLLHRDPNDLTPERSDAFEVAVNLAVQRMPGGDLDFGDLDKVVIEYPCFGAKTIELGDLEIGHDNTIDFGEVAMVPKSHALDSTCSEAGTDVTQLDGRP